MRYFLLIFALCTVMVVAIAGKRGSISRKPPIEVFPDMDRQPKLRPQTPNNFFADGKSSRLQVAGTVARDDRYEDAPVNTGKVVGKTNFVDVMPVAVTSQLLARGQQRFNINCSPCHGAQGDGNGITKKIGAMAVVANLHDKRIVTMADGEIFSTITYGKGLMGAYGPNVTVEDRWAITAYLRALQLSRLGTIDDVPEQLRATFKK
ncbi:MAG: cytochrome [Pedosphaera sp.]|nr:cytochrome [Pedosphaera sp.]